MSLPPQNAVNKGYDALPSRSAKFNTGWDTPSIFLDTFSFAIRNPRGDSIATVFIACWRNAASGYSTSRFERSRSNKVCPILVVFAGV